MQPENAPSFSILKQQYEKLDPKQAKLASYDPPEEEKKELNAIISKFSSAWISMTKGRTEFDDLSAFDRYAYDMLVFNNYNENNGERFDPALQWRDNNTSPIARNKAYALVSDLVNKFPDPKVLARDINNEYTVEGAMLMDDLLQYVKYHTQWKSKMADAVTALSYSPASYTFSGYQEVYKKVKLKTKDGKKFNFKLEIDQDKSGIQIFPVPFDQLFLSNAYEPNIQNQEFVIWRRVISYDTFKGKYSNYENSQYVKPGVMTVFYYDSNSYYEMTDKVLGSNKVEELLYWNKDEDSFHVVCNGVKLTQYDNPNPRKKKSYPFSSMKPGKIRSDFAYGKSFVHLELPDVKAYNRARQLITDGTYLGTMAPLYNKGTDIIDSSVIAPGVVLGGGDYDIQPLLPQQNLRSGVQFMQLMQDAMEKDLPSPASAGQQKTAYESSLAEQKANRLITLYLISCADFSTQVSDLILEDVVQYLTLLDAKDITTANKSYFVPEAKDETGKSVTRKIVLDAKLPKELGEDAALKMSSAILQEEDGQDMEILKAHPEAIRHLTIDFMIDTNAFAPKSEEIIAQMNQQTFATMSAIPNVNLRQLATDLILDSNVKTKRNPDKYWMDSQSVQPQQGADPNNPNGGASPNNSNLPQPGLIQANKQGTINTGRGGLSKELIPQG